MAHVRLNPPLDHLLMEGLVAVWTTVSNGGGAVGFVPPVTPSEVWPVADAAFSRVRRGLDDLAVAYDDASGGAPVGFGFLATNDWPLARHWGSVKRLQRHPVRRGRG
ncbi:MAG TPA: hypothetical protein VM287_12485, partial [Egibacteraceae bacterium]|nr:hypothetical protein [Egibacteraceae bacterium]